MSKRRTVFIASGIAAATAVAIIAASFVAYFSTWLQPTDQPAVQAAGIDLPMPEPVALPHADHKWHAVEDFDPLWIQNVDVTNPTRKDYIQELNDGAFRDECRRLLELREAGELAEYYEGLARLNERFRLRNTRCKIDAIWRDQHNNRGCLDLIGETGAKLTIFFPLDD